MSTTQLIIRQDVATEIDGYTRTRRIQINVSEAYAAAVLAMLRADKVYAYPNTQYSGRVKRNQTIAERLGLPPLA
jgi:post-segregation antitoxin (ccd killing protein)